MKLFCLLPISTILSNKMFVEFKFIARATALFRTQNTERRNKNRSKIVNSVHSLFKWFQFLFLDYTTLYIIIIANIIVCCVTKQTKSNLEFEFRSQTKGKWKLIFWSFCAVFGCCFFAKCVVVSWWRNLKSWQCAVFIDPKSNNNFCSSPLHKSYTTLDFALANSEYEKRRNNKTKEIKQILISI